MSINRICGYALKAYLGLSYYNDQGQKIIITEEEFNSFIPTIASYFPDGFTIYEATGGFSYNGQTVTERTKVLEVVVPLKNYKYSLAIFSKLVDTYSVQFKQLSEFWTYNKLKYISKNV